MDLQTTLGLSWYFVEAVNKRLLDVFLTDASNYYGRRLMPVHPAGTNSVTAELGMCVSAVVSMIVR